VNLRAEIASNRVTGFLNSPLAWALIDKKKWDSINDVRLPFHPNTILYLWGKISLKYSFKTAFSNDDAVPNIMHRRKTIT
jgi:hypothetical protein